MLIKNIPNFMTLTHLFFGILAIIHSFNGLYGAAAFLVLLGMILDGLDGRVARALNVSGDFGKELDSLADVVTFGVAPAMIMYNAVLVDYGTPGIVLASLFPISGVWRLAKFNTETFKHTSFFVGLPITAAGGILSIFALYQHLFPHIVLILFTLLLSYLMISKWKYPNFKKVAIPRHAYFVVPIMTIFIFIVSKFFPEQMATMIFIPVIIYSFFVLHRVHNYFKKKKVTVKKKDDPDENVYR